MANKGMFGSVDDFLSQCQQSSDAAYGALRSLLERLEDPNTRSKARIFLSDLQKRFATKESCDQCFKTYHFRIEDIFLGQYEGTEIAHCPLSLSVSVSISFIWA